MKTAVTSGTNVDAQLLSGNLIGLSKVLTCESPSFYPDSVNLILPLCAPEYGNPDFYRTTRFLDEHLNLGLSETQQEVISLLQFSLSNSSRFEGDLHVPAVYGEDSAVHQCHTALLVVEMFRRAGLLDGKQSPHVAEMRFYMCIGALIHDMGEMLGEFNTLANRAFDTSLTEVPDVERLIFEKVLRGAYRAVLSNTTTEFYAEIKSMREALAAAKRRDNIYEEIGSILQLDKERTLHPKFENEVLSLLSIFDMCEIKDEKMHNHLLFAGYAVKAIEHLQGTRHMLRFAHRRKNDPFLQLMSPRSSSSKNNKELKAEHKKGLTLPFSWAPCERIRAGLRYTENEVGHLFKYAKEDYQLKLASVIRDSVYLTQIEFFSAVHKLFERNVTPSKTVAELAKRCALPQNIPDERKRYISELKAALGVKREVLAKRFDDTFSKRDAAFSLQAVEPRKRLMGLYQHAIENDYIPDPDEHLALHDRLPRGLQRFENFNLKRMLRWIAEQNY